MRVRTGRFEKLRSTETGYFHPVGPLQVEYGIEQHPAVAPPAPGIGRYLCRNIGGGSQGHEFPIGRRAAFPLFKLDSSHPMPHPLIQISPDLWCLRQPEVALPSQHIDSQPLSDFRYTATARTAGQFPNASLE